MEQGDHPERAECPAPPAAAKGSGVIEERGTVEVPANVFVRCPAIGWKNIQARRCEPCQWFHGLHEHAESTGTLRFAHQYRVKCGFPIDRALIEIELG
jgi:imidazoleglycerol phosphate synthase glutamine amidotransferase subunit HisH